MPQWSGWRVPSSGGRRPLSRQRPNQWPARRRRVKSHDMAPESSLDLPNLNLSAGFVSRFLAFWVDVAVITLVNAVVTLFAGFILNFFHLDAALGLPQSGERPVISLTREVLIVLGALFNFVLVNGYFIFFWYMAGRTPGKALFGLSVVSAAGRPLTFGQVVRRLIGYWLSALPLFLGFLWILIDDRRQAWHDKLARTGVIYGDTPDALKNFRIKRKR
jgi:uncharacterized RDD family membrane protein YckC